MLPSQAIKPNLSIVRDHVLSCFFKVYNNEKFLTVANRGTFKSYDSRMNFNKFFKALSSVVCCVVCCVVWFS